MREPIAKEVADRLGFLLEATYWNGARLRPRFSPAEVGAASGNEISQLRYAVARYISGLLSHATADPEVRDAARTLDAFYEKQVLPSTNKEKNFFERALSA